MNNQVQAPDVSIDSPYVKVVQTFFRWAASLKQDDVYAALTAAGVPTEFHPVRPSDNTCLKRAMEEVANGRRDLIRPLKKGSGWSLVIEHEEMLDLSQTTQTDKAHTVELTGRVVEENHVMSLVLTPDTHPMCPLVRAEFEKQRGLFQCSSDLSQWMTQTIVPYAHGVSGRDRGGFYYIPKGEGIDRFMAVVNAIHSVSTKDGCRGRVTAGGKIYLIPSVHQNDLVEAVMDSVIEEADRVCCEMEVKLTEGQMGRRALATQADRARSLEDKLKRYEQILGESLDDLKARVGETQAAIGMAEMALDDEIKG